MTDRHKHQPITFRPPEGDRAWLYEHAERTGLPVRRVLVLALAEYRAAHSGDTTPHVETPAETPQRAARKRAAKPAAPRTTADTPPRCPPKGWCAAHQTWHGKR
jgi:hypothetical protein